LILKRNARYRPHHQEPIIDKKLLAEPLPEDDPHLYFPIKAPLDDRCPHFFNNKDANKFINMIMMEGDKQKARRILFKAFEAVKRRQVKKWLECEDPEERVRIECNPQTLFQRAIKNSMPVIQLRPVKRGGITYQVPSPINEREARFRAMQWMRDLCREKELKVQMWQTLSDEILAAAEGEGKTVKKKQEVHKLAEANRAYAHYRWT